MKTSIGRKVMMVMAKNKFRDEEHLEPKKALESEGPGITVASSSLGMAEGMLGLRVKPDALTGDVKGSDNDGIVLVGGGGAREYFDSPVAHALARSFYGHGKVASANSAIVGPSRRKNKRLYAFRQMARHPGSLGM